MKNSTTSTECPYAKAIHAFSAAWEKAVEAYDKNHINSERCLQAFLYSELRKSLVKSANKFSIYIEPKIVKPGDKNNSEVDEDDKSYNKGSHIDTVIVHDTNVVLAVELKFTPRGKPRADAIKKDLASLSFMHDTKTKVSIKRIYGRHLEFIITNKTKIALGIFFAGDKTNGLKIDNAFFGKYRPTKQNHPASRWKNKIKSDEEPSGWRNKTFPDRFYVFGAKTNSQKVDSGNKTKVVQIWNEKGDANFAQIPDKD